MALRRDPSWLCGARWQMEGITSRESDVQEPRAKRADRGREDSHGRPKEEERNIASSKRTVPIRAGGLGHPGAIRHPATKPSFFRGHAEHSNTARRRCVVVVVL